MPAPHRSFCHCRGFKEPWHGHDSAHLVRSPIRLWRCQATEAKPQKRKLDTARVTWLTSIPSTGPWGRARSAAEAPCRYLSVDQKRRKWGRKGSNHCKTASSVPQRHSVTPRKSLLNNCLLYTSPSPRD
eukprot:10574241-Alexandrium_andersonii.AAC.1